MHITPVVILPHDPETWVKDFTAMAEVLEQHPQLPLTVRAPGAALEQIARDEPELWSRVTEHDVLWLAGGYSDPCLALLPKEARRLQLTRERTAMDIAGVEPAGLWVGVGWEQGLVTLASESGLPLVFLDETLFDDRPLRPGAVERAGDTVIAISVGESPPSDLGGDGLTAVQVPVNRLAAFLAGQRGRLLNPDVYLERHLPGPRLRPLVSTPALTPDNELVYRKLLMLTRDQRDRTTGQDDLMGLQSRSLFMDDDDETASSVHRRLLEARKTLDRSSHRGDSWVTITNVDWDADGVDEIQIETANLSVVLDPAAGTLDLWDDKDEVWPITAVKPALAGVLVRRLTAEGEEPPVGRLYPETRTEGRGEALVVLSGEKGETCRLEIERRALTIELSIAEVEPCRVGPEIPVWMEQARLRVDGGEWVETAEPVAVSGHRFRLTSGERALVVASPRPCELFVRPLPGRGLMIWPHWMTGGGSLHRVTFTPT